MSTSGHSTHLPILQAISEYKPLRYVLEFGAGEFSTVWFMEHVKKILVTCDTVKDWIDKAATMAKPNCKWNCWVDGDEWSMVRKVFTRTYDLILVDGPDYRSRKAVAQVAMAMGRSPVIVCHDSEQAIYGYSNLVLPHEYHAVRVEPQLPLPWTLVLSTDQDLLNHVWKVCGGTMYAGTQDMEVMRYPAIPAYKREV